MAKKPKLTLRQRTLAKKLLSGVPPAKAAIQAGYSAKNPDQSAHQAIAGLQEKMPELMDKVGLTDEKLLRQYLVPLLNAKETKFAQFEGEFTDRKDVIAWGPRERGLDMAFKLKGRYAKSEDEGPRHGVSVIIVDIARPSRPAIEATPTNGHKPQE
jgi:hypothetical protein